MGKGIKQGAGGSVIVKNGRVIKTRSRGVDVPPGMFVDRTNDGENETRTYTSGTTYEGYGTLMLDEKHAVVAYFQNSQYLLQIERYNDDGTITSGTALRLGGFDSDGLSDQGVYYLRLHNNGTRIVIETHGSYMSYSLSIISFNKDNLSLSLVKGLNTGTSPSTGCMSAYYLNDERVLFVYAKTSGTATNGALPTFVLVNTNDGNVYSVAMTTSMTNASAVTLTYSQYSTPYSAPQAYLNACEIDDHFYLAAYRDIAGIYKIVGIQDSGSALTIKFIQSSIYGSDSLYHSWGRMANKKFYNGYCAMSHGAYFPSFILSADKNSVTESTSVALMDASGYYTYMNYAEIIDNEAGETVIVPFYQGYNYVKIVAQNGQYTVTGTGPLVNAEALAISKSKGNFNYNFYYKRNATDLNILHFDGLVFPTTGRIMGITKSKCTPTQAGKVYIL